MSFEDSQFGNGGETTYIAHWMLAITAAARLCMAWRSADCTEAHNDNRVQSHRLHIEARRQVTNTTIKHVKFV